MSETTINKDEVKINHFKTFLSNPISYVAGMIALGSVVFAWGVSSANKGNSVSNVENNQVEMKSDIKSIQTSLSLQNQDWTQFKIDYTNDKEKAVELGKEIKRGIIVLDTAMVKHFRLTNRNEERIQFLEDQLKKNDNENYLFWINKDTTLFGTILGLKR